MNVASILALIGDLYAQISRLQQENDELRKVIAGEPNGASSGTA